jgi:hypothetical protein
MLHDPVAASSKNVVDLWANFEELPLICATNYSKANAFAVGAYRVLNDLKGHYIPPPDILLRAVDLNASRARELRPGAYRAYLTAYLGQMSSVKLAHFRRALIVALSTLNASNRLKKRGAESYLRSIIHSEGNVSYADAGRIAYSARWFRPVLWEASQQVEVGRASTIEKEPRWLRFAFDGQGDTIDDPAKRVFR